MKKARVLCAVLSLAVVSGVGFGRLSAATASAEETGTEHPWSLGLSAGWKDYEGEESIQDRGFGSFHLSYDVSPKWTLEGVILVFPSMMGNTRTDWATGEVINRLWEKTGGPGVGVKSTSGIGFSLECLYHLTRWERVDPYFVVGAGMMFYQDAFIGSDGAYDPTTDTFTGGGGKKIDPTVNAGVGVMYHFNDEWALRADVRTFLTGVGDLQANSLANVGVEYTLGAGVPPDMAVGGGPLDSDADGLTDAEEAICGTDPQNPDTDGDRLSDYDEVKVYKTNPLEPDTDFDLLNDGEEVLHYKTDPRIADTDRGGVSDGHEVLEDNTDPLNGADDLLLYTLNIEFDTDKAVIKPEYYPSLDVIGKVMVRHPGSTAVVEGHADKRKKSAASYNQMLSEKRAKALVQYLRDHAKIEGTRLTAKGFGFSRPLAPNDLVNGNPKNRRVEVYIEGAKDAESPAATSIGAEALDLGTEAPAAAGAGAKPAEKAAPAALEEVK